MEIKYVSECKMTKISVSGGLSNSTLAVHVCESNTSKNEQDELCALIFFTKPATIAKLQDIVRKL